MPKTKAKACTGKVPHPTKKEADAHLTHLIRNGASPAVWGAYRCKADPSHWHVGHRMRRKS